jgi:hypothetical protein
MEICSTLSGLCENGLSEFRVANVRRAGSSERAAYINDGCSPSKKNIIIGYIVIGLHSMFAYNALSGLGEIHLSEFKIATVRLAEGPERAANINDGCRPSGENCSCPYTSALNKIIAPEHQKIIMKPERLFC